MVNNSLNKHNFYIEKRANTPQNERQFLDRTADKLSQLHFDSCLTTDPTPDYNKLDQVIVSSYEETIPIVKTKVTKYTQKDSPWITLGLLNAIKTRDILYKKLVKTKSSSPSYDIKSKRLHDHKVILNKLLRKTKGNIMQTNLHNFQMMQRTLGNFYTKLQGIKHKNPNHQAISKRKLSSKMESVRK